jgi:hypothetical protein
MTIALVTLARLRSALCLMMGIRGQRPARLDLGLEPAFLVPARVTLIAFGAISSRLDIDCSSIDEKTPQCVGGFPSTAQAARDLFASRFMACSKERSDSPYSAQARLLLKSAGTVRSV